MLSRKISNIAKLAPAKRSFGWTSTTNSSIDYSKLSPLTQHWIAEEDKYVCIYYPPIPVIVERGERCYVWDVDNKRYFDCMGGFASVSQGHCNPKIVKALTD